MNFNIVIANYHPRHEASVNTFYSNVTVYAIALVILRACSLCWACIISG